MGAFLDRFGSKLASLRIRSLTGGDAFANIRPGPPVPVPEAEILEFEAAIGTPLPAFYRQFLKEVGGSAISAQISLLIYEFPEYAKMELPILLGGRHDASTDIWGGLQLVKEGRVPANTIPIGDDFFGVKYCLAIRGDDLGKIFLYDESGGEVVCLVANSFEDLLERLEPMAM